MFPRQTLTFVAFVLPVPVSKLLAFGSGDVNIVGTVHYRRDGALAETDIVKINVKIMLIQSMSSHF